MKKVASLFLLFVMLISFTACGNKGLFVVENLKFIPGTENNGGAVGDLSGNSGTIIIGAPGSYSYEIVGTGETDAIYTVHVQIGIYDSNGTYLNSIYNIHTLKENERETVEGSCLVPGSNLKLKVLKITWD